MYRVRRPTNNCRQIASKCTKSHINSKSFPGVIPRTPVGWGLRTRPPSRIGKVKRWQPYFLRSSTPAFSRITATIETNADSHCKTGTILYSPQVNSDLHPSGVAKSSTSFGWGKGWNVTSAGWQVTLCDPIWHVSSRSGAAMYIANCYIRMLYFLPYPEKRKGRERGGEKERRQEAVREGGSTPGKE